MNIISLNIWGGRAGKVKLLAFFEAHRDTTDVFCLQEVWSDRYDSFEGVLASGVPIDHTQIMTNGLQDIAAVLPDHVIHFHPTFHDNWGLCTFVRKELDVRESGDVFVHKFKEFVPEGDIGLLARNIQYVTIERDGNPLTIINFHGLWNGQGKGDSEDRLIQSDRIIAFTETLTNPFVLVGDFNLTPDTESLMKFEHAGMRNLVREYGITSTRSELYTKPEKFADYAFTSPGIEVTNFEVLLDTVSDHAPLSLTLA